MASRVYQMVERAIYNLASDSGSSRLSTPRSSVTPPPSFAISSSFSIHLPTPASSQTAPIRFYTGITDNDGNDSNIYSSPLSSARSSISPPPSLAHAASPVTLPSSLQFSPQDSPRSCATSPLSLWTTLHFTPAITPPSSVSSSSITITNNDHTTTGLNVPTRSTRAKRKREEMASAEFPHLAEIGLYASDIAGDGNCLFNAFSDQLYGHQREAATIRAKTVEYLTVHEDYFQWFVPLSTPNRQQPSRHSKSKTIPQLPSEEARLQNFRNHVHRMAKNGVYGDNVEVVGFARAYGVDVQIYQEDDTYRIAGVDFDEKDEEERQLIHIAYHRWEHYSSVRNIAGPHSGPPEVTPTERAVGADEPAKKRVKEAEKKNAYVADWMVKIVFASLPYIPEEVAVKELLGKHKGDIDTVVSMLLDAEYEELEKLDGEIGDEVASEGATKEENVNGEGGEGVTPQVNDVKKDTNDLPKSSVNIISKRPANTISYSNKHGQVKPATNKPKRETAREKKERIKREKMAQPKNRPKPSSTNTNSKSSTGKVKTKGQPGSNEGGNENMETISEGFRIMHV